MVEKSSPYLPLTKSITGYTYRIPDPYSVILYIHRPAQDWEPQRFDLLGVFCQPTTGKLHRPQDAFMD